MAGGATCRRSTNINLLRFEDILERQNLISLRARAVSLEHEMRSEVLSKEITKTNYSSVPLGTGSRTPCNTSSFTPGADVFSPAQVLTCY